MEVLAALVGGIIGIAGILLANRQNAAVAAATRKEEREERAAIRKDERAEAVRQEHLAPYRALKDAMSQLVGTALHVGKDYAVLDPLLRNCMIVLTQIHDEEIQDLVTKIVDTYEEWKLDDAGSSGKLLVACHDLAEGVDRIIVGNRSYIVKDSMLLPEPEKRLQLP